MRTMASVWFSVIVLVSIQKVFGDGCLKDKTDYSCNECIRCGGNWCNERRAPHCSLSLEDDWCPNDQEILKEIDEVNIPGVAVRPTYAERTLYITNENRLDIQYTKVTKDIPKVTMIIHNSTQNFNIEINEDGDTKCDNNNCTMTIAAMPRRDFCSATGSNSEFAYVKIKITGLSEEVLIKYHVPCECNCSRKVEQNSKFCGYNGDYSCGVCSCYAGWTGEFCNKIVNVGKCPDKRGDVAECSNQPRNDADCSNNGYCGPCETCICYKDREGSQYFDQQNKCADLCMVTGDCEDCLLNNTIGECDSCGVQAMTFDKFNESLTETRDVLNRKVWVSCNVTINDCYIEYYTKKTENGEINVMVKHHCNDAYTERRVAGPVPIIMGVLGIIAVLAAVGGVMLWKHLNTVPPVPLNDPQYQNIDAEDCTGENPLYKPPTSSFKNPTYGKW